MLARVSDWRTFDRWPKGTNGYFLGPWLWASDLRRIENDADRLPLDLSWQQLRLER